MSQYDAFISYNHAKDKPIAAALQSVIQKLGNPWYRRRALRVFRDDTSLSATPTLWPSIERALRSSRFMILLASPEAAASQWVNKEISCWLDNRGVEALLIAVTDGDLAWDNTVGDFIGHGSKPLPRVLTGRFNTEPKWIDLRAYRNGADPHDSRFIDAGADFAAAIHGTPKEDLLSQEVRQQRRALTLAWSASAILATLIALSGWQWWEADLAKRKAQIAEQVAQAQRDQAERNFGIAKTGAEHVVFRIAQDLRNVRPLRAGRVWERRRRLAVAGCARGRPITNVELNGVCTRCVHSKLRGGSIWGRERDGRHVGGRSTPSVAELLVQATAIADPDCSGVGG